MADPIKSRELERLVNELRAAHGENLTSITLYGSAAHDDRPDSKLDVLVVLRRVVLEDLRLAREPILSWTRAGQPMPVYFSTDELQRAADVFPIEFLQMEQARKVLYGSDPFEFVEISNANLRHQTEYELRTKFLGLRRLYFSSSASAEQLTKLMTDSLASFAALFRAVLILKSSAAPITKKETIGATVRLLGLDALPFNRLIEIRDNKTARLQKTEADELFGGYLTQLERVIDVVDKMGRD